MTDNTVKKLIVAFSALILLTTGCWSRKEIDSIAIILAIGVDRINDGIYEVTAQCVVPRTMKPGTVPAASQQAFCLLTGQDKNVSLAMRKVAQSAARIPYWNQNRVVVVGEELARTGLSELVDYLGRNPDFRLRTQLLVTSGKASSIVGSQTLLEQLPALGIMGMLRNAIFCSEFTATDLKLFLKRSAEEGIEPFLTRIEVNSSEQKLTVAGAGVFKDMKLIGWLTPEDVPGLLWLTRKIKTSSLSVKCPKKEEDLTVLINKASTKVRPRFDRALNGLVVEVTINAEGRVYQGCAVDFSDPNIIRTIENEVAGQIQKKVTMTVQKVQDMETDIFGLGREIYRSSPSEWNRLKDKWEEEFKTIPVKVHVDFRLRSSGQGIKPLLLKR